MEEGLVLRVILVAYFALYVVVRAYYRARTGTLRARPTALEGAMPAYRAIVKVPWLMLLVVWLAAPQWLQWSMPGVPWAVPWLGVGFLAASLGLLTWVHHTLGDNFSPTLRVKPGQELVTHGPYRYIRHPMYAAVFLSVIGVCLVTSSWVVALISIPGIVPALAKRMSREEAMMVGRFGEAYRAYMRHTGRVLPKFI